MIKNQTHTRYNEIVPWYVPLGKSKMYTYVPIILDGYIMRVRVLPKELKMRNISTDGR